MKRRRFIKATGIAGAVLGTNLKAVGSANAAAEPFHMKFAPHLGMFKHHAGDDPIDQLNFMADQGFSAFEDNGMSNREVSLQEKMAKVMSDRGLEMGVFVAHKIYWKEPTLAKGDEESRKEFLGHISNSVEVAK